MGKLTDDKLYARNIYLVGTAENGPVNVPILARNMAYVKTIFGKSGTLIDAFSVVADTDTPCNVWLVKTSGGHGEVYLNILKENGEIIKDGFLIKSRHANESANNIEIHLDDNAITFTYPMELGGNTLSYSLSNYDTLHDLAATINEDTKIMKGEVFCSAYCEPHIGCKFSLAPVNSTKIKLIGGDSGLHYNKNMLYNAMEVTYSVLEGQQTDIIVPLEMYYDDTLTLDLNLLEELPFDKDYLTLKQNGDYLSFYKQLLDFCRLQMQSSIISHGIMGLEPGRNNVPDQDALIKRLGVYNKINELSVEDVDFSHMISVIASDMYAIYGTLVTNAYVGYAVLLASTKITDTTTNRKMPKSFILYNNLEQSTLNQISEKGYVCFRNSPLTKCIHVVNGVTTSKHSELKFVCNVRMIQVVMKNVKYSLAKYIGQNIDNLIESGELNKEMENLMRDLNSSDLITNFSALNVVKRDEGHLLVDLSFATRYMIEEIKAYSGLSAMGDLSNGLQ